DIFGRETRAPAVVGKCADDVVDRRCADPSGGRGCRSGAWSRAFLTRTGNCRLGRTISEEQWAGPGKRGDADVARADLRAASEPSRFRNGRPAEEDHRAYVLALPEWRHLRRAR